MTDPRVCLITGANTGIGRVTALELARDGMQVFLASRSADKTLPVVEAIRAETNNPNVEFIPLELGNLNSVRSCAENFLARGLPLHVLINNAGLAGSRGLTQSGFELAFGVNHLGHFLLTELLTERLRDSAPARIVNVASKAHYRARGYDWPALERSTKTLVALREYSVSKLANIHHANELARRLQGTGVSAYSLHPGVVASDVWRQVPQPFRALLSVRMISVEKGALTTLHCARRAPDSESGLYYHDEKPKTASAVALDGNLAGELWERSEGWVAAPSQ